jgi:4-alpha-glucanotransferase
VDALAHAQQSFWQILPLNPTGYGDSPYQSYSAFAGNRNLISPDRHVADRLLQPGDVYAPGFDSGHVQYGPAAELKDRLLNRAFDNFRGGAASQLRDQFEKFRAAEKAWLDDYVLFRAIKIAQGGKAWNQWPRELMTRQPAALTQARKDLGREVEFHAFSQFLFFRQWGNVKQYANERGIRIIGDVPIFVAGDSADVWANPDLFQLDANRNATVVAGVPPDYFSATGQLWGNPLYDWGAMKAENYAWWVARLKANLRQVDLVRLDHFRGFEAAWHIPFGSPTAQTGVWVKGPAADLFHTLKQELGGLPLIAEDLGLISEEVHALRDQFGLPGMCILQFAYGGAVEFRFLPHNHARNAAVYTGTHDNDTTRGWWLTLTDEERARLRSYMPHVDEDPVGYLIRTAWGSVADFAIVPLQDVLDLGPEARMNVPGVAGGNWHWRVREDQLPAHVFDRLSELTYLYNRHPEPEPAAQT